MRVIIYQALINEPTISNSVGGRIYQAGSLGIADIPPNPKVPYVLIKQEEAFGHPEVRGTSPSASRRMFQIFCYGERGDFETIDSILAAVRQTMSGAVLLKDNSTGTVCIGVKWVAESGDLTDSQSDVSVKYSTFETTSNK